MTSLYVPAVAPAKIQAPPSPAQLGTQLIDMVGNTPLLSLPNIGAHLAPGVKLYAKAEWTNPGGSVKDRPALNIIRQAMRRGALTPGITLLDATSGNMGIAYAMIGRALGVSVEIAISSGVSPERINILRAYGAKLHLTDPDEGTDGAIARVHELYNDKPARYFWADQFNNRDNWRAHYIGTGPEIWRQTEGQITHFVAGMGTSGTMMGVGRRLKQCKPGVKLVALQPDQAFHGLQGLKHMPSAIVPGIYDSTVHDEVIPIRTEQAYAMCRRLAREEGLLVGISAGAALAGALAVAERLEQGVVVTVLPDNAYKYLSQPFWQESD